MRRACLLALVGVSALAAPSLAHAGRTVAVKLPKPGNVTLVRLDIAATSKNAAKAKLPRLVVLNKKQLPPGAVAVAAVKRNPKAKGRFIATVGIVNRETKPSWRSLFSAGGLSKRISFTNPSGYNFTGAMTAPNVLYDNATPSFFDVPIGSLTVISGTLPPGLTPLEFITAVVALAFDRTAGDEFIDGFALEYVEIEVLEFPGDPNEFIIVFTFHHITGVNDILVDFPETIVAHLASPGTVATAQGKRFKEKKPVGTFTSDRFNVRFSARPKADSELMFRGSTDLGVTWMPYVQSARFP